MGHTATGLPAASGAVSAIRQAVPVRLGLIANRSQSGVIRRGFGVTAKPRRGHVEVVRAAGQPGGGVLDRPAPTVPGIDWQKDTKKKKPPSYRVMLHNDNTNRREYVVQVLMKVVDGLTVDDAVNVMQEAHINGLACVIVCSQETSEQYCEGLRTNGLVSSIEPVGPNGS